MRASGILLPIASLPSRYGIGCFSKEAYEFADQLRAAGQKYWQLLPLGPTGYGDSPYQSFSTFAGNPYFIDLEALTQAKLLEPAECEAVDFGTNDRYVDYAKLYAGREQLLRKAFQRSRPEQDEAYLAFVREEAFWLPDYALYMAIKARFGGKSWLEWDPDIRLRRADALHRYRRELAAEIAFHQFVQYQFYRQWQRLKRYVNACGIEIIGDIPIYVAMDSADAWAHPELFQFDEKRCPTAQAGVPPDGFSATGQLWGNPLYDWPYHRQTGYAWWQERIRHHVRLYDIIRIDHFRGLDEYYSVPIADQTAEHGTWRPGPGMDLFRALKAKLGPLPIIAEDLGYLTDGVRKLLQDSGFPGMKVLQFAFDSREAANYQPHTYSRNCVVYTGTHDNSTVLGWYDSISNADRAYALEYVGRESLSRPEVPWAFIRLAQASVADTCIIPLQDYLELGSDGRINTPSTLGTNWQWRLLRGEICDKLLVRIRRLTQLYGRDPDRYARK